MSVWVHGVSLSLSVGQSFVEGHEIGFLAAQFRGEEHLILVHGEVGEASPEVEYGVALAAVFLVLPLSVVCRRLVCPRVFQLEGHQWQSVDEHHHVNLVAWRENRVSLLSCHRELVCGIFLLRGVAVGRSWSWEEECQLQVLHAYAFFQHVYYSEGLDVLIDALLHFLLHLRAYIFVKLLLLRFVQEAPQSAAVDGKYRVHVLWLSPIEHTFRWLLRVNVSRLATFLSRRSHESLFYQAFKCLFVGRCRCHCFCFNMSYINFSIISASSITFASHVNEYSFSYLS